MERLTPPRALAAFRAAGGVIDYSFFLATDEDLATVGTAMQRHFSELDGVGPLWRPSFDAAALETLPRRKVDKVTLFGSWYEPSTGELKKLGSGVVKGKGNLTDPLYSELGTGRTLNWAGPAPEAGTGGQYAYAFTEPPHGLSAEPATVQSLFDDINSEVFPSKFDHLIVDWSGEDLVKLSNYFEAGMEWWGVLLFTVYVPHLQRLTVVSASTTD